MPDDRMTVEEIRRMYKEAKDQSAQIGIMADINDCSPAIILKIVRGELDDLPPPTEKKKRKKQYKPSLQVQGKRLTAQEKDTILRMHQSGKSCAHIADTIGRAEETVRKYVRKLNESHEEEEKNVIFAEDLNNAERDKLTEEVEQATAPKKVECDSTIDSIPDGNIECVAGGMMEYVAELCAKGYTVSVEPVNDKGVITVTIENGNNYACLKRRMSKE